MKWESENYLQHHGILGQKWGVRRFQNGDGTLTPAGRSRYDVGEATEKTKKDHPDQYDRAARRQHAENVKRNRFHAGKAIEKERQEYEKAEFDKMADKSRKYKEAKDKRELIRDVEPQNEEQARRFHEVKKEFKEEKQRLSEEARRKSREMIEKKYGNKALSDIDYYTDKSTKQKAVGLIAGLAALATAVIFGVKKLHDRQQLAADVEKGRGMGDALRDLARKGSGQGSGTTKWTSTTYGSSYIDTMRKTSGKKLNFDKNGRPHWS